MLSLPQYLRNILYEYMMGRERKVRKLDQHKYVGNCPPTPSLRVNVGLGEGKIGSCPDTDIDP